MSIIIKGITPPPPGGLPIYLTLWSDGTAEMPATKKTYPYGELRPHGRLIDADAFLANNKELADCDFIHPRIDSTLREIVEDADTIVVAEGNRI